MELICTSRYRSSAGSWEPGDRLFVKDEEGEFLLRDSPSSFRVDVPAKPAKPKKADAEKAEAAVFDLEKATVDELVKFAASEGIELEADASEEDIRAAIALALEERAKAKLETAKGPVGGNTRPQSKSKSR